MSMSEVDEQRARHPRDEPTPSSTWRTVADSPITDGLLEWPPDVFALTDVILAWSGCSSPPAMKSTALTP